jgi:hypothetical protein
MSIFEHDLSSSFWKILVALKRADFGWRRIVNTSLLGASVLGDSLGSLADGVLGELSGKEKTHGSLHFTTGDRRTPVVVGETGSFGGNALEDVVHEAVHDGHCLTADTSVWVDLLQHLVDVDGIALSTTPVTFLVTSAYGFRLTRCFLRAFARRFWRHFCEFYETRIKTDGFF